MNQNANNLPKKILIVDDDRSIATTIQNQMSKYNINVQAVTDLQSALYIFNNQRFDVCIVELEFEPLPGLALVQKFRAITAGGRNHTGMIIASGRGRQSQDDLLLKELGELEFVEKPLQIPKLLTHLSRALERKQQSESFEKVREVVYQSVKGGIKEAISKLNLGAGVIDHRKLKLACEIYENEKQFDEALRLIDSQLELKPNDVALLNHKAKFLLKAGKNTEARQCLEAADRLAPRNVERIETLAKLYLACKQPDESVGKMKEMITLHPELQDLKFDLIRDLDNAGFQDHAVKLCHDTTSPMEVVRFYNNKGVLHSKEGDRETALKEYYMAIMLYPKSKENYRILFNIALAEAAKKTPEGFKNAQDAVQKCLKLNPNFDKAKNLQATLEKITPLKAS